MGRPKGFEPYTDLFKVEVRWTAPMATAIGTYLTRARWQTWRYYHTFDEAMIAAATPYSIQSKLNPFGPIENTQVIGPTPFRYFNTRIILLDLLNSFNDDHQVIATGI